MISNVYNEGTLKSMRKTEVRPAIMFVRYKPA